jgi:phosphoserine phosphatase RsbU/P
MMMPHVTSGTNGRKISKHAVASKIAKGMPAALLMANLQAAVRVLAAPSARPDRLCEQLNRLILNNTAPGKFITFFYALVDAKAKRLTYANAGHNPPIMLRRDGTALRLNEGGAVLGVLENLKYLYGEIDLAPADRLLLFTDGVSEAQDLGGRQFGEERLMQLLKSNIDLGAADLQWKVIKTVSEFSYGVFHDDVTVVAMTSDNSAREYGRCPQACLYSSNQPNTSQGPGLPLLPSKEKLNGRART